MGVPSGVPPPLTLLSLPSQADKRAHHNALERKRRDHIKDSFHSLRDSVPSLQGEKVSLWRVLGAPARGTEPGRGFLQPGPGGGFSFWDAAVGDVLVLSAQAEHCQWGPKMILHGAAEALAHHGHPRWVSVPLVALAQQSNQNPGGTGQPKCRCSSPGKVFISLFIPLLQQASRAQILDKATEYIQYMRRKNHTHQQDIDDLKRQNALLEQQGERGGRSGDLGRG